MAKYDKGVNCTNFSLDKKSVSKDSARDTDLSSKKVLGKVGAGEKRAPAYELENINK